MFFLSHNCSPAFPTLHLNQNGESEARRYVQTEDKIHGAIIGANSIVGSDVDPYTIVAGNPAKHLRKRFDEELIGLLLKFKWWDKSVEEINSMIPILTCSDLSKVKAELEKRLNADSDDYEDIHDPCLRFQR